MPSDSPTCSRMGERFAVVADGLAELAESERHHVAACLRCQAEQAQYRRLMRAMRSLRSVAVPVDPALADLIIAGIDGDTSRVVGRVSARTAATIGGLAAGAAAAAGVFALAARQWRVARLAS